MSHDRPAGVSSLEAPRSESLATRGLKAFSLWMLILVCAVINGVVREGFLLPLFGAFTALVASGLLLCACIIAVSILFMPWFGALNASRCLLLGLFWLSLTLVFEFGFGRLLQHKSWAQLFEAYTFRGGNLWPLVLLVTALAPLLAARWRGLLRGVAK